MQTEKKTFTKAEMEIIRFDRKNDIITTSVSECTSVFTACCQEPMIEEEGEW